MPFLNGVADRAPLHILFAICKRYFFGNNGIAVLEISCKIEGGGNDPSAVLTDIAIFACFFILIGGKPFGKPHSPSGILFGNAPVFIEVQLHIFHPAGCNLLLGFYGNNAIAVSTHIFPGYDGFQLFACPVNQENLAAFFLCKGFAVPKICYFVIAQGDNLFAGFIDIADISVRILYLCETIPESKCISVFRLDDPASFFINIAITGFCALPSFFLRKIYAYCRQALGKGIGTVRG